MLRVFTFVGEEETVWQCGGVSADGVMFVQNVVQIVKLVQKLKWVGGGMECGETHIDKNKTFAFFFIVYGVK
jgi:hypothetical protein